MSELGEPTLSEPTATRRGPGDQQALLTQVLARAVELADDTQRRQLTRLVERVDRARLRVLVAGEAKRGKSTLINALLDRDVLPTGVLPLTSIATTVTTAAPGRPEGICVRFRDDRTESLPLDQLPRYVTESQNPRNAADVQDVVVQLHHPLLDRYPVDLVDSPGTGSVHAHNTVDAKAALSTLDAAVLVLSVDPPISAAERDLLRSIAAASLRTFVVLNKTDRHTAAEVDEALRFTSQVCRDALDGDADVIACSARRGRADEGFTRFCVQLAQYLTGHAQTDAVEAIRGHIERLLMWMLQECQVRRRAHQLLEAGGQREVAALRERLEYINAGAGAIQDRCSGSAARLRRDLDERAAQQVGEVTRRCLARLARSDNDLGGLSAREVEPRMRQQVETLVVAAVEDWRRDVGERLEDRLSQIAAHARDEVAVQLRLARESANAALGLDLQLTAPTISRTTERALVYDFSAPVGWDPPLRSTLSRMGTERARRARAYRRVRSEVPILCDRHIGRARSQLQDGLERAIRQLNRDLHTQFADTVQRLVLVLNDVTDATVSASSAASEAQLTDHESALVALLQQLEVRHES